MNEIYRFRFGRGITTGQIERLLLLAALNTEDVFGETAMRLDASFRFDRRSRVCLIDRTTEIGRHIAKLFIAYVSREFGDDCYSVERIQVDPDSSSSEKMDCLIRRGRNVG